MASMANITVKADNGTTDVVFTAVTPSGGDNTEAQWRANAIGATNAAHPFFGMKARWNAKRNARRVEIRGDYPYAVTDSTTGVVSVRNHLPFNASFLLPTDVPDAVANEMVSVMGNLIVSSLIRTASKEGTAPQ